MVKKSLIVIPSEATLLRLVKSVVATPLGMTNERRFSANSLVLGQFAEHHTHYCLEESPAEKTWMATPHCPLSRRSTRTMAPGTSVFGGAPG